MPPFCSLVYTQHPSCSPCLMHHGHPQGGTLTKTFSNEFMVVELSTCYCSCMSSECSAVETWLCMVDVEYCRIKRPCGNPHFSVCRLSELTANPASLSAYTNSCYNTHTPVVEFESKKTTVAYCVTFSDGYYD